MTRAEIQQVKQRFGIIGNTEALSRAIDVAIQVAPTDLSVLITGESGVGKETFPQIIHQIQPAEARAVHSGQLWCHSGGHRLTPNCSGTRRVRLPGAIG